MTLPSPRLDDRDFAQLVEEARRYVQAHCPDWSDLRPGDPGTTLIEAFAYLTDVLLYRLNRLPEKAYVEFLRLLGVTLRPPAAATASLLFQREKPDDRPIEIPRGTRVTVDRQAGGEELPVFVTGQTASLEAGETETSVLAYHCEVVEGERAGTGTGLPGQAVTARRPPIVAPTGDELDLVVGVEEERAELGERARAVEYRGKAYRIWREVEHFTGLGPDRHVYLVDRVSGLITFAPAARMSGDDGELGGRQMLAEAPQAGKEIRLWYRRGGGPAGNVAANTLTKLKDSIRLGVSNPQPATGGRSRETLENALKRGPQELHSLRRTVTASDYEALAVGDGAVARARAYTKAARWAYAAPGTVEVLVVPQVPAEARLASRVTVDQLRERQVETTTTDIQRVLDRRRPLGTQCIVSWAPYKPVSVTARVVVYREEDLDAVRGRALERLNQLINPLSTPGVGEGWPFGEDLRASHVYDLLLREPGVKYVDRIRLVVEEAPEAEVSALIADRLQNRTWYAASSETLFRSEDDGEGWEAMARLEGERIGYLASHPEVPGLLALTTRRGEHGDSSGIYLSRDCADSLDHGPELGLRVRDLAWMQRDGVPVLLMATSGGLYELALTGELNPIQVLVNPQNQDLGFYSVAVATDVQGGISVAVGAEKEGGVYLSTRGGRPDTFRHVGLNGKYPRVLEVQYGGPVRFLWAGMWAEGEDEGEGCFRLRLRSWSEGGGDLAEEWEPFADDWQGGSCYSIAFGTADGAIPESTVLAGTTRSGVLTLDADPARADRRRWSAPDINCGLPVLDRPRFEPVNAVAVDRYGGVLMAGGPKGISRSADAGKSYVRSIREFPETVTLPESWLFCSGDHELTVVSEDEADAD